ncbi:hypothetical protein [Lacipirellula parvula]|uniref:Uncharacterized protein n=1 Tax=Lacipirellula parvula TaxID=2650471 RepID=A0A5K7XBM9_9BACT|nr:hypothetical protein [Lacipirellula parvula]BBO34214.1 hypothetical protein PLANPX_3826 [Lacipirellula parvula]
MPIDPRVAVVRTQDAIVALGMRFSNEEDLMQEVRRRDAAAGSYKLNPVDLYAGVPRGRFRDDRSEYERVSQNAWSPVFDTSDNDGDSNPWRRDDIGQIKAAAGLSTDAESRRAFFKRSEREVDEKEEREAFLAADKASPERAAAIEYATNHWRSVAFDINQPLSAVILSEQMLAQASTNGASLTALKEMSVKAVEQQKTILAERRDRASLARLAAQQAFNAAGVEPTSFGGTPGISPGDTVTKMRSADGVVSFDVVSAEGVLRASYTPETVPAAIQAAADQ